VLCLSSFPSSSDPETAAAAARAAAASAPSPPEASMAVTAQRVQQQAKETARRGLVSRVLCGTACTAVAFDRTKLVCVGGCGLTLPWCLTHTHLYIYKPSTVSETESNNKRSAKSDDKNMSHTEH
jgi:hypothetical protein